jgi:hypothetical protein
MKTLAKVTAIMAVLVVAFATMGAVSAYAQGPNPTPGVARGNGPCQEAGLLNVETTEMHAAIADALGISESEFDAMRADGTSLYLIAQELGVDIDTVRAAMNEVRDAAIDEALATGTITEEQAEWMRSRAGMGGYGNGYGYRQGPQDGTGYGMRGRGRGFGGGQFGNGFGQGFGSPFQN